MNKQQLINIVTKYNNISYVIDVILYNLYKHRLYVYKDDVYFFETDTTVNSRNYDGVYNLFVREVVDVIEIVEKVNYPFDIFETTTFDYFKSLKK